MKGDFSRLTFDRRRRYSGVLMQQGRVQTDADWNEQLEIQHHRAETEARDVIGPCGVPKETGGFEVQPLGSVVTGPLFDLSVSDGRIYVDGLLCESEASEVALSYVQGPQATAATLTPDGRPLRAGQWVRVGGGDDEPAETRLIVGVDEELRVLTFDADLPEFEEGDRPFLRRLTTYLTQPDLASPEFAEPPDPDAQLQLPTLSLPVGYYLAYLHVFERHVTALDDPLIREKALGGPDTTTRVKNVWQVGLLPIANENNLEINCDSDLPEWDALVAPPDGLLNARTRPEDIPSDPCLLPPEAGYRRLENQLYRVEIHTGGTRDEATFKWSRENASVQTKVEKVSGSVVTVSDLGRDEVLGFAGGQWVEVVDDESELAGIPRPLALINEVDPDLREVTLDTDLTPLEGRPGLRLRRWEQAGPGVSADAVTMTDDWQDLEGGIQVQFSEGTYRAGDYWLIPARTATAEIEWPPYGVPNTQPQPQPPRGVRHHFCRLAVIFSGDEVSVVDDCRKLFPPLTHVCAEDVCFDNSACEMPNVETVQDAIEHLCHERDLRFHKKHLHGWGIVCGLQVHCGPDDGPRRHVTVRKGYAIDCEGNDIIHESDESFDLMQMIEEHNAQNPNAPLLTGNGEVCLVLTGDAQRPYALERYDPDRGGFKSVFKNTLWEDFFQDCLGALVEFVRKEFSEPDGQPPALVSPARKRLTTLFNLLIQLVNKSNGRFVYLSGERGLEDVRTEHTILRNLYTGLRGLLQSHTFCGMFDDTQFPEYPFAALNDPAREPPYIPTIFGKHVHTRLRLHPRGATAYTCGNGNWINVYDLVANEMVAELRFPDDAARVQDLAFSADGSQLYAVATINGKDSLFAVADINGTAHNWKGPSVVCDVLLKTLATRSRAPGVVYAAGYGKGIYEINVGNVQPNAAPAIPFNSTGHLIVVEQGTEAYAFATGRASGGAGTPGVYGTAGTYDHVARFNLNNRQAPPLVYRLQIQEQDVTGSDDIAVALDERARRLYVVTDPPSFSDNKHLLVFSALGETTAPVAAINLEENTAVRLAYNPQTSHLMLTYSDSYRVRIVNPDHVLAPSFRHPVQVAPMGIAFGPDPRNGDAGRVYVLNSLSKTITSVPAGRFEPGKQVPLQPLVDYRAAVLEAFVRLFGGLLQYLKDCFCDHLLVNCPECDEEDKIYLGCVEIRDRSIYKICNFSKRKYVKSFPTVEYWLSLVPVIPLIGKAVEGLCCLVLPEWFGRYTAPRTGQSPNTVKSSSMLVAAGALSNAGMSSFLRGGFGDMLGGLLKDRLECAARDQESGTGLSRDDIVGRRLEDVRGVLRVNQVRVAGVDEYDPCNGFANFAEALTAPSRIAPGSTVCLVAEDGKVRGYSLLDPCGPGSPPTDFNRRDAEITEFEPPTFTGRDAQTPDPAAFAAPTAGTTRTSATAQPAAASAEEVESLRQELAALRETVARLEAGTRGAQTSPRPQDAAKEQAGDAGKEQAGEATKERAPAPAKQRPTRKPKAE